MLVVDKELENRFRFYPADTEAKRLAQHDVRRACRTLAEEIVSLTPEGRAQSIALTHVEEVLFWASAAIVRDR